MDDLCYRRFETSNGKCLCQRLNVIVPLKADTDRELNVAGLNPVLEIKYFGFYFVALRPGSNST